jgi:hypothetical protein
MVSQKNMTNLQFNGFQIFEKINELVLMGKHWFGGREFMKNLKQKFS